MAYVRLRVRPPPVWGRSSKGKGKGERREGGGGENRLGMITTEY